MTRMTTAAHAREMLEKLCSVTPDRHPGSSGNREATRMAETHLRNAGWTVETPVFSCMEWEAGPAELSAGEVSWEVFPGPYSLPCDVTAPLIAVSRVEELEVVRAENAILLLHGDIAKEQLMPRNFVFYNPVHHQRVYELLDRMQPAVVLAATSRNPELAGSMYPFPLIEDGDFDIPNAYMRDRDGEELLALHGTEVTLRFAAKRIPAEGCNVIARREGRSGKRVVVSAHIDAKKGTPGACDNGSGVVIQLLLAELLSGIALPHTVELAVLNGEDYYAASGQMRYMEEQRWENMLLNINIDGVGPAGAPTAFSLHQVQGPMAASVAEAAERHGIVAGPPWYQGDHMMFVQQGVPAVALTTSDMQRVWTEITHTAEDRPEIIDPALMVDAAAFLAALIPAL